MISSNCQCGLWQNTLCQSVWTLYWHISAIIMCCCLVYCDTNMFSITCYSTLVAYQNMNTSKNIIYMYVRTPLR